MLTPGCLASEGMRGGGGLSSGRPLGNCTIVPVCEADEGSTREKQLPAQSIVTVYNVVD
jgi:hypothetical protein